MTTFYVYIHSKPDGEPFYVGKGHGDRAFTFALRAGRNRHHRNIVSKYGAANIKVNVTHCTSECEAFEREILTIKALRLLGCRLVNQTDGGDGPSGSVRSAETRAKISAIQRGRRLTPEHKAAISRAMVGVPRPPNTGMFGKRMSQETKMKMSLAQKGRPRKKHSEETKAKMSAARMGHPVSEETKKKLSMSHIGKGSKHTKKRAFKNLSPEHKARISEALRKHNAQLAQAAA